jgi:hypothetical protein
MKVLDEPRDASTAAVGGQQRESPVFPVNNERSDLSEPRTERGGRESRQFHSAFPVCIPTGVVRSDSNSGKLGVGWRSPGRKNANLPESDAGVSPSQVDGTARTGQANTHTDSFESFRYRPRLCAVTPVNSPTNRYQAYHPPQRLTACAQPGVPPPGTVPPVVSARPPPRERGSHTSLRFISAYRNRPPRMTFR